MSRDLAVQLALQPHQVVGEDLLGGIQGEFVGGMLGLSDCAFDQAGAVAVGDQLRNQEPADEDDNGDGEQQRVPEGSWSHGPSLSRNRQCVLPLFCGCL